MDLIVISRRSMAATDTSATQVVERVKAGAHLVQVGGDLVCGGPYALCDLKRDLLVSLEGREAGSLFSEGK